MRGYLFWTENDAGCYGYGALGHDHVRRRLAEQLEALSRAEGIDRDDLVRDLRGPMSDDAWEEELALEVLNDWSVCQGVYWTLRDGDLMLLPEDDE